MPATTKHLFCRQTVTCYYMYNETQMVSFKYKAKNSNPAVEVGFGQLTVKMRLAHGETYDACQFAAKCFKRLRVTFLFFQTKCMTPSTMMTSTQWPNFWGNRCTLRWDCCSPRTKGWSSYWRTAGQRLMRTEPQLPAGTSLTMGKCLRWIEFQTVKIQALHNLPILNCIPVAAQTMKIVTWQHSTLTVMILRISNAFPWTCSRSQRMTRFSKMRWAGGIRLVWKCVGPVSGKLAPDFKTGPRCHPVFRIGRGVKCGENWNHLGCSRNLSDFCNNLLFSQSQIALL